MPAKRAPAPCRSHPLYNRHDAIKQRCTNPNHIAFKHYGKRGIKLHEPWYDAQTFIHDVEQELGPFPQDRGWTIDRINNNGDYVPGNLRYATKAEQNRNKRTVSFITVDGVEHALTPGMRALGLSPSEACCAVQSMHRGKSLQQLASYYRFDPSRVTGLRLAEVSRRKRSKHVLVGQGLGVDVVAVD